MQAFHQHTGIVAPLPRPDIDTDQFIPKQFLKRLGRTGYDDALFYDWRFDENWLLRATLGLGETQAGQTGSKTRSGLDLLWQYRY